MARVTLEAYGPLGERLAPLEAAIPARLEVEVAPGDTLGRLLERLTYQHPPLESVYLTDQRRLTETVSITINGQPYHLLGGLSYLLHDLDTVALHPVAVGHPGSE